MTVIECEVEWDAEPEALEFLPDKVLVDLHDVKWTEESDDLEFEITEENSSDIADYIADLYGQCVFSFNYRVIQ
jgi:hypothetical protein